MGVKSVGSERIQVFVTDPFFGLILSIKNQQNTKEGSKREREGQKIYKTNRKQLTNSDCKSLSLATQNIKGLKLPIKRYRDSMVKSQDPTICYL